MADGYFSGPFAPMCEKYVAQKRATGLIYETQAKQLRQFDNFCKDFNVENFCITEEIAKEWYKRRNNEMDSSRRGRIQVVHNFAEYLNCKGYSSFLFSDIPSRGYQHVPYIFDREQIKQLFSYWADKESNSFSTAPDVCPSLFRVLYGCGLRISEALKLQKQDVDLDEGTIWIKHAKNENERVLPISQSLCDHLGSYMDKMHSGTTAEMPLFYTKQRTAYHRSTIGRIFRNSLWDIGIVYRGKDCGPRLHDLRHTFACHNIQDWAEQGIPIESKLPILSKYLGHRSVIATMWYLRLTGDVYPHIRQICDAQADRFYNGIYNPEVSPDE